jgi:hypothetical protein
VYLLPKFESAFQIIELFHYPAPESSTVAICALSHQTRWGGDEAPAEGEGSVQKFPVEDATRESGSPSGYVRDSRMLHFTGEDSQHCVVADPHEYLVKIETLPTIAFSTISAPCLDQQDRGREATNRQDDEAVTSAGARRTAPPAEPVFDRP